VSSIWTGELTVPVRAGDRVGVAAAADADERGEGKDVAVVDAVRDLAVVSRAGLLAER
jgi:hypothetical protein